MSACVCACMCVCTTLRAHLHRAAVVRTLLGIKCFFHTKCPPPSKHTHTQLHLSTFFHVSTLSFIFSANSFICPWPQSTVVAACLPTQQNPYMPYSLCEVICLNVKLMALWTNPWYMRVEIIIILH